MRKTLSAIAMFMLIASTLAFTANTAGATHNGENCEATYKEVVDKPAWTETVEHDAEYEYIEHPAIDPVIEPGVWANWAPNDTRGPQDYRPVWPEDDRGKWIVHDQGVPPGHQGPDGVYQQGTGNSPYFYRQAEKVITEGQEAWVEKKLTKEARTETIKHEATYKTVVDVPGHCEPVAIPPVDGPLVDTPPTVNAPDAPEKSTVITETPLRQTSTIDTLPNTGAGETFGLIILGLVLMGAGFYLLRRDRI